MAESDLRSAIRLTLTTIHVFRGSEIYDRCWIAIDNYWIPAMRAGKPLSTVIDSIAQALSTNP